MDRRSFLPAAAALALAACGGDDGLGNGTAPTTVGTAIDVTAYTAPSANGGVALVTVQNTPLAIVRVSDTTYLALSLVGNGVSGERTSRMKSYPTTYNAATHQLTIG